MGEEGLSRCFIAIDFPDELIKEVARIQEVIEGTKFIGKFTELENLHLTLKFLGEMDENKLNVIKEKLKSIKFKEMDLKLGGIGMFSFKGNPKIVWIKVLGERIWALQKEIDSKMQEIGFEAEKGFASHITIARLKYVADKKGFKKYIDGIGVKEISFKIKSFKLMKSELGPLGPAYACLEEFKSE